MDGRTDGKQVKVLIKS